MESHYHYRIAAEMAAGDLAPNPGRHLPMGALGKEHPVDHHWGLHLIITPFAALGDLLENDGTAMHIASAFFGVASIFGLFLVIRLGGGALAGFLCLLPLAFGTILWRLLQLRGGGLMAVGLLLWAIFAFKKPRPLAAGITAALLMVSYHGAFLLLPLSCAALGAIGLLVPEKGIRIPKDTLLACAASWAGAFLALVVGPYGVKGLFFLIYHLKTSFGDPAGFYGSNHEFSPFSMDMLLHFPEYLGVFAGAVALGAYLWRQREHHTSYTFAMTAMTIALVFLSWRSHRMVEYALPFFAVSLSQTNWVRNWQAWPKKSLIHTAFIALLLVGISRNINETHTIVSTTTTPSNAYEPTREILQGTPGIIGNLFQGDFSLILWQHPEARCLQGLNHYFTHHDPEVGQALETLKAGAPDPEMQNSTAVLISKGVTLFTQRSRKDGSLRPFGVFAEAHPELFSLTYGDKNSFCRIWTPKPGQNPRP